MRAARVARGALLAGLAAVLAGCAGSSGSMAADYPAYETVGDLAAASDAVVQGVVLDERTEDIDTLIHDDSDDPELNPQAGLPDSEQPESDVVRFIVYRIEVAEAFGGAVGSGEVVEVNVREGESAEPEPRLDVGAEYLLFLGESYDGRPRYMVNPDQAAYRVEADGAYTSLQPESTIALEVTPADLAALNG